MKKLLSFLVLPFCFHSEITAQILPSVEYTYTTEINYVGKDTLIVLSCTETSKWDYQRVENTIALLLQLRGNKIDTLLINTQDGYAPKPISLQKRIESLPALLNTGNEEEENVVEKYYNNCGINHLEKGIYRLSASTSEHHGSAHGYGEITANYYYDFETKTEFGIDDIFTPDVYLFLYKEVINQLISETPTFELTAAEDSIAMENLELSEKQYYLDHQGFFVEFEPYEKIYGFLQQGSVGSWFLIPYPKLEPFFKRKSPIRKLVNGK
jgi:hypothetical protein